MLQTILLAEDDPNDIFLMQRVFQKIKIDDHLQVVGNGKEAVAYLSGEGKFGNRRLFPFPSLVISDLKMPIMDGLQLLQWMHSDAHGRFVPAVLLSASGLPSDVATAYRLGVCSYYIKPASFIDLTSMVKHIYQYWMKTPAELDSRRKLLNANEFS